MRTRRDQCRRCRQHYDTCVCTGEPQGFWSKVIRPRKWRPEAGEVLEGFFRGFGERRGDRGLYREYYVQERMSQEVYYITGAVLERLIATVPLDTLVRVVYLGREPCRTSDWSFNNYELYKFEATQSPPEVPAPRSPEGLWS